MGAAIEAGDAGYIKQAAVDQDKAGATYIDANAGIFVGEEARYMKWLIETIQSVSEKPIAIGARHPGVHFMCGLSNISYGLPARKYLNRIFMAQAISNGLDGAIINPLDKGMMGAIAAAEALAGKDKNCIRYLRAYHGGLVGD